MKYQEFKINKDYKTIYYFLKEQGFAENFITNLRKVWGNLKINNEIVNIRQPLKIGDKLEINSSPNKKTTITQCIIPLDIVYDYYI